MGIEQPFYSALTPHLLMLHIESTEICHLLLQVAWGSLAAFPYYMDMFELGAIVGAHVIPTKTPTWTLALNANVVRPQ